MSLHNVSRGKQFETVIKEAFQKVDEVSIDRLHDQTTGYAGSSNICDFIVYKYPYQYYIECKTVHGNTLPFSNITKNQWRGLLEKSEIKGVISGILCWWVDCDETWFIPIRVIEDALRTTTAKSINLNKPHMQQYWTPIVGRKKRVFFDYDMDSFFHSIEKRKRGKGFEFFT